MVAFKIGSISHSFQYDILFVRNEVADVWHTLSFKFDLFLIRRRGRVHSDEFPKFNYRGRRVALSVKFLESYADGGVATQSH